MLGKFEFKAWLVNNHTVVVTAPLLDYHDAGNDMETIQALLDGDLLDDWVVLEALLNFSVSLCEKKKDNLMHYHLDFGPGVNLCSECLAAHNGLTNGLLHAEGLPVSVSVPALSNGQEYVKGVDLVPSASK